MTKIIESNLTGYPELSDSQKLWLMTEIQRIFNNKYECVSDHSKEWLTYNTYLIQAIGMNDSFDIYNGEVYQYVSFIIDNLLKCETVYSDAVDKITGFSRYLENIKDYDEKMKAYRDQVFYAVDAAMNENPDMPLSAIFGLADKLIRHADLERQSTDDL